VADELTASDEYTAVLARASTYFVRGPSTTSKPSEAVTKFLGVDALDRPIRFVTGIRQTPLDFSTTRFRRLDGLVDGGTIEHLEELQRSQRALHDYLDPSNPVWWCD